MNSSFKNETISNYDCIRAIFLTDLYNILLNTTRIVITLLYFIWLIIILRIKELRIKKMAFLNNLIAIGFFYCTFGLYYLFYSSCFTLSDFECIFQSITSGYFTLLPNYGLTSFAIYKLFCSTTKRLDDKLKSPRIYIYLASVWLLPAFMGFLLYLFDNFKIETKYYPVYRMCSFKPNPNLTVFILFIFISAVIPNLIMSVVYIYLLIKSKNQVAPVTRRKRVKKVTVQHVIFIIIFEIYCLVSIIGYYLVNFSTAHTHNVFLQFIRVYIWFNHFGPLGLFYLHSVLQNKYKEFYFYLKQRLF